MNNRKIFTPAYQHVASHKNAGIVVCDPEVFNYCFHVIKHSFIVKVFANFTISYNLLSNVDLYISGVSD